MELMLLRNQKAYLPEVPILLLGYFKTKPPLTENLQIFLKCVNMECPYKQYVHINNIRMSTLIKICDLPRIQDTGLSCGFY